MRLTNDCGVQHEYAAQVADRLAGKGLFADVDNSPETLNKKIRNGEIAQYNFIFGAFACYYLVYDAALTHVALRIQSWVKRSLTASQ